MRSEGYTELFGIRVPLSAVYMEPYRTLRASKENKRIHIVWYNPPVQST